MTDFKQLALARHKALKGKLSLSLKDQLDSQEKLSIYYTPGVAAVSDYIAKHPKALPEYTWTNNVVAIISDGSAVLGLGDIGPAGALPVMEGKAMLFKHFAGIDAVPIVLDVHEPDEIIAAVKAIAPSFGGINLEDIAAPKCFEIETQLKKALPIPVMHDDQHGTAIVTLAGLINACKVTGRTLTNCKIVITGAGAAGMAIARLLSLYARPDIIAVDSKGIIASSRDDLNAEKQQLLQFTNSSNASGSLEDAIQGVDIFIGVSQPGLLTADMVQNMARHPIVFAMANPVPEIMPDEARAAGAAVIATGRSDFPNQVNNALAFPGIFRGALDSRIRNITDEHKVKAAEAIAALVEHPTAEQIIPSIFDERLVEAVAAVIR